MSDIPALPSAIGIEAVECVADTPSGMTVRVTGRWRRRRPEWHGPAMLVIEAGERRHRVPAMPEPPSLTGTLPGTWRMSFSVPEELVEHLRGRTWLQLGAVMAPLSLTGLIEAASEGAPSTSAPSRPPIDPALLAERQQLEYEFAAHSARRRAEEAETRGSELQADIARLQEELAAARREPERLQAEISGRERQVRALRQQLHAESALREEVEQELAERERELDRLRERARHLTEREHELERELRRARRAVDEAEHHAALARAALAGGLSSAEARVALPVQPPLDAPAARPAEPAAAAPAPAAPPAAAPAAAGGAPAVPISTQLAAEAALLARARERGAIRPRAPRLPASPLGAYELERALLAGARQLPASQPPGAELQLELAAAREALVRQREAGREVLEREREAAREALEREREAAREVIERERESARAALERAREPSSDPQVRALLEARETLARELASARLELSREREARRRAEERLAALEADLQGQRERSARALEVIAGFRRELLELSAPAPGPGPGPAAPGQQSEEGVEPERLSAALERLREQHPPTEPPTAPGGPGPAAAGAGPAPGPGPASPAAPAPAAAAAAPGPAAPGPAPSTTRWSVAIGPIESAAPPDALPRLFRRLARQDPAAAGRLVLQLLPAQPLVHARPVAYDLVLGPGNTLQVTSPGGPPRIELGTGPRPADQTQFRVQGDAAELARLLAAGPLRRRLSRHTARLTGETRAFQALRALVSTPLSPRSLLAAGVQLGPPLAMRLASLLIDPAATAAERFSIAHRPAHDAPATATLHILDGAPPAVSEPALGRLEPAATATIVCEPAHLLAVLLGDRPRELAVEGDERPLSLLARWLERG